LLYLLVLPFVTPWISTASGIVNHSALAKRRFTPQYLVIGFTPNSSIHEQAGFQEVLTIRSAPKPPMITEQHRSRSVMMPISLRDCSFSITGIDPTLCAKCASLFNIAHSRQASDHFISNVPAARYLAIADEEMQLNPALELYLRERHKIALRVTPVRKLSGQF